MMIGILGIPFDGDGTRPEIENPAAVLRKAGLSNILTGSRHTMLDLGDLEIPDFDGNRDPSTRILNLEAWKEISRRSAKRLLSIQKKINFVVIPGGDCSILLGIFGAFRLAGRRVGLMILDGHTDYRDPSSSPSGEPADIALAILTGRGPDGVTGLFGLPPLIQPEDVVICGYREPDLIAESTIHHFDHHVFRKTGAENLANKALSLLGHMDRLWFHFDVDVLDPILMPVSFPEPDGLSFEETLAFLSTALCSGRFLGLSVACYHPRLDPDLDAASKIVKLIGSALSPGLSP